MLRWGEWAVKISVDGETHSIDLGAVVVAGYTGRDRDAVQHHIDELAAIGVPPPAAFPAYWIFPPQIASTDESITVVGGASSGEAEVCLIVAGADVFVTVGSDHTDRAAEAIDIGLSKAICPKPMATEAWWANSLGDRWESLVLRSWIDEGGREVLYQEAACSSLVHPLELLSGIPFETPRCFALLTGTVPVKGAIRPSSMFRAELCDPQERRSIALAYDVHTLDSGPTSGASE